MEGVNKSTHPEVPGEPTHTSTALLETATATIQGFGPINKIHQHLCAPDADARLIGLEYIVSEELFLTLPDEEKRMWHSHEYEVKSGVLFMPGMPGPIQRQDLEKVCKTYGKVFHFWQVDKDVEKGFGVSFDKERENRAYMTGPAHGIHPLANGGGKGLKTVLREVDCKPVDSVPRVFV
ncbi:hypothetical protein F0562_000013 [Nyssa sinensis]|uniref:DUF1264 domain-containing protein n=1 Tax=Nyssa sinensis TaxID=561372 RepID=A0A5J5BZF6_9ASTE|nr:hypothetical protein F0562_000013 [Nyssa sinensis]